MKCFEDIDNIFFDFDGTLCDSEADIKAAWRAALAGLKLDVPHFDKAYRTGPPTDETARNFFPDADASFIERLCEAYRSQYYISDYSGSHPYPGVETLLKRLRKAGKKLFVATNKTDVPMRRLLDKFGWETGFTSVLTRSMLPPGVKDKSYLIRRALAEFSLDPRRSAMVGDTAIDIAAGKAAGVVTVAATYGYGSIGELTDAGADRFLNAEELTGGTS